MVVMTEEELYEEQLDYIRTRKEEMFSFLNGVKLGFDLNVPYYFYCLTYFELKKKYKVVSEAFNKESFVTREYNDILDRVTIQEKDNFSLKESFKAETVLSVISSYVKGIVKIDVYPSVVRRKEQALANKIKRAQRQIDAFFESKNVLFQEVKDVVDFYELNIGDNGSLVDLHYDGGGMSLSGATAEELLSIVEVKRKDIAKNKVLYREKATACLQWMDRLKQYPIGEDKQFWEKQKERFFDKSDYEYKTMSPEKMEKDFSDWAYKLTETERFLNELTQMNYTLSSSLHLNIEFMSCGEEKYAFNYKGKSASEFKKDYEMYQIHQSFMSEVLREFRQTGILCASKFINGLIEFNLTVMKNEGTIQSFVNPKRLSMQLVSRDNKLYRLTGEEVLTSEVIAFELKERIRNINETYIDNMKRAKNMFVATLSVEEEKLLNKHGITVLEGEQNYYAVLATTLYNNVIKIPKSMNAKEDIKALCIHPSDSSVPMFDGLAAIAMAVKSGDEQYVLENSNEFKVGNNVYKYLKKAIKDFVPKSGNLLPV